MSDKKEPYKPRVFHCPDGYKRLAINIPEDMHKEIKLLAVRLDTTVTDLVVMQINNLFYLNKQLKGYKEISLDPERIKIRLSDRAEDIGIKGVP